MYVHWYVCDFIKFLTAATLPVGKFRYRLFLDKVTSLLKYLKSQPQKVMSSVKSRNAKNLCFGNLEFEIYEQITTYVSLYINLLINIWGMLTWSGLRSEADDV